MDEEQATLDGQFVEFARFMEFKERDGSTITLWRSDYWMRHCKLLDDRKLTMTDTGIVWNRQYKSELTFDEWHDYLADLCLYKGVNQELWEDILTNCGTPGSTPVTVPQYRDFFDTFKPASKLML